MKIGFLILSFCLMSLFSDSQGTSIKKYDDSWHVRLFPDIRRSTFQLENSIIQENLTFRPNNPVRISAAVNKGNFGAGISLFKLAQNSTRTHGKTSGIDLFAEVFRSSNSAILRIQRYNGWYSRENPSGIPANLEFKNYVRPDIRNFLISARIIHYFNSETYSIKAPLNFTEVQLKSAGSLMASLTPYVNTISADSSFIPGYDVMHIKYVNRLALYGVNFGLGYTYTFVFDSPVFVNITSLPSLGLSGQLTGAGNQTSHSLHLPFQILLRGTMGYNTEQYFFGISPRLEAEFSRPIPQNHRFSASEFQLTAYLGMRW